jgi:two-component system response regulator WspF
MRVGIVNDVAMAVEVLRRIVISRPEHEVLWIARDGAEAVRECARRRPDVVLMDLVMPGMDGVEATRRIMAESPCPILVVTSTVAGHLSMVYEAMGHGALDAIETPTLGLAGRVDGGEALLRKMETVARLAGAPAPAPATAPAPRAAGDGPPLVAIGASTGGPDALATLLHALPASFPPALVVVQHVDRAFAPGLADWLQKKIALGVGCAREGDRLRPGHVWIAASDDHLVLGPGGRLSYTAEPRTAVHRPSVDVFFASAARHANAGCGIVLTGMGRDGARGLLALREAGFRTFAQDRESSVIFGMPGAAIEAGAAREVLAPAGIGARLVTLFPVARA